MGVLTPLGAETRNLFVALRNGTDQVVLTTPNSGDGLAGGSPALAIIGNTLGFNGATFDRWRNNNEGTVLASAARTATTNSSNQVNHNCRGVLIWFNVTVAGTGTLTLSVSGNDPISGSYNTILTAGAVAGAGLNYYEVYPGAAGGVAAQQRTIPRTWRITVTHSDGSSWTYSVARCYIV